MPADDRIARLLSTLSGELGQQKLESLSGEFDSLAQDRAETLVFFVLHNVCLRLSSALEGEAVPFDRFRELTAGIADQIRDILRDVQRGSACFDKLEGRMKTTRQIVADKIADYLHGKVSQAELVDWAERVMMDAEFEEADMEVLSDIIGRLGLADVAEFGLRWQDCEEFLRRLGYRAKVIVSIE